jgi:hypothetical protein
MLTARAGYLLAMVPHWSALSTGHANELLNVACCLLRFAGQILLRRQKCLRVEIAVAWRCIAGMIGFGLFGIMSS